jgi:urease accessory protein
VGAGGALALVPDPIVCFSGARYAQSVEVQLDAGASLVLVDAFTAGRTAHGERWAFDHYKSQLRIDREGTTVLRDAVVLDPEHGPIGGRMGRFDAFATLVVVGPRFAEAARRILDGLSRAPIDARASRVEAGSPLGDGALVRIAATTVEGVSTWLRDTLGFAAGTFGGDPGLHKR